MRAALLCDACHDLLEVPMILPQCGHSFCSRCIRSYLDSKGPVLGDCPSCREKVRPDELVRNIKLKELILQYRQLEATLRAQGQPADEGGGSVGLSPRGAGAKRSRASPTDDDEGEDSDFESVAPMACKRARASSRTQRAAAAAAELGAGGAGRRSNRLSARRMSSRAAAPPTIDTSPDKGVAADVVDLSDESSTDGASVVIKRRPSGGDGRVECPICNMSISERNINAHMDTCLSKTSAASSQSSLSPTDRGPEKSGLAAPTGGATATATAAATAAVTSAVRMPKMTYHVLKEPQLRKLCKDLGLSTKGDRSQLEWRHRQYAQEHNTACDAEDAPNSTQIVLEVERLERNMAAPAQSRPSIFSRRRRQSEPATADSGAGNAATAAESVGDKHRDASQDAAFEDLIQQIEARLGRKRKRVYTYVYESAEEEGEDERAPVHPAAMFRMECGRSPTTGAASCEVDLRVEVDGINFTELVSGGCSDKIPFVGLSWEITDDGLTLMYTSTSSVAMTGGAGASRVERSFRCTKEVAMDVQRAVIAAMHAERQRQQQTTGAATTAAAGTAERTDSAESLAVSPPADVLSTVPSASMSTGMAAAAASVSASESPAALAAEADAKTCRVCYCGEGELDVPTAAAANTNINAADLLQPCKCNSWIHRKCLQDWISSRSACSTDQRRQCEVCEEPIDAADRVGALQAAPPPSAAQLKAVGIKKFSALCGFKTCTLAGTGEHYHCVLGHELAGRTCTYSSKDAKAAERHGLAMTKMAERRRRASSAPEMVAGRSWSRVAA